MSEKSLKIVQNRSDSNQVNYGINSNSENELKLENRHLENGKNKKVQMKFSAEMSKS